MLIFIETREVLLTDVQLAELLNYDPTDREYNDKFYNGANGKMLIGMHICAAEDTNFANEFATYLSTKHADLEFYLSFNANAVPQQSQRFFKEYNKEDKGHKIN